MVNKLRTQHYILFLAAVAGAVWFFSAYPGQDVRSVIDYNIQTEELKTKATQQLTAFGYSAQKYQISNVSILDNESLIASLQDYLGRPEAVQVFKNDTSKNLKPYYWQIAFTNINSPPDVSDDHSHIHCDVGELCLRFDMKGRFMALLNPSNTSPNAKIQRKALEAVFASPVDTLKQSLFISVPDSVLTSLLYFNIEKTEGLDTTYHRRPAKQVQKQLLDGMPYQYSASDARALGNFYIRQTGWKLSAFTLDTAFVERSNTINPVSLRYILDEPLLGQQLTLNLSITSTGSLMYIKATYNKTDKESDTDSLWGLTKVMLFLIFVLVIGIIFFFRIRSRAVDTRPAIITGIIIGVVTAVNLLLVKIGPEGDLNASLTTVDSLLAFISIGVGGAFLSIAAFVFFATGDSVTRQFWSEKLRGYDYLRQGMVFNQPVGTIMLKSVALAFVLAGYWTLLLSLFPGLYFSADTVFLSQHAAWPSLYLLTESISAGFFVTSGIFLLIAGRVYGWSKKKWLVAVPVLLASGLVMLPHFSYGPEWLEYITAMLLGLVFYLVYLKYDYITLALSYILFLCLLGSTSGWIISDSPDLFVFIWTLFAFVIVAAAGIFAIYFGEDEQRLTSYVPDYIQERANEERIKQELKIARDVQQSFLPKKTPDIEKLDIAAACQPAYETGGDYYDFMQLDENRIAVAIGDVSGKGIQSAFYMTFIKGLLHSLSHENVSPAEVLKRANRFFYDNADKSTFISLVYGVIDLQQQTFTFARAGHNPVIHLNTSNHQIDELRPNGLGLGLTKEKIFDNKINEIELSITDDDLFLLYTDGITEALDQTHEFYGTDRLIKLLRENDSKSAAAIIDIINKEVTDFIGQAKQHDDMTIMAIQFAQITELIDD